MTEVNDVRTIVREKYGAIAEGRSCGCGCGCAADQPESAVPGAQQAVLGEIGYSSEQAAAITGQAWNVDAGVVMR